MDYLVQCTYLKCILDELLEDEDDIQAIYCEFNVLNQIVLPEARKSTFTWNEYVICMCVCTVHGFSYF